MRMVSLASNSKGNCTYLETNESKILIDIGIPLVSVENALAILNINPAEITAIVVSHEHNDHIKGIPAFSNKYKTPIYAYTRLINTLSKKFNGASRFLQPFESQPFFINDLQIIPVQVPHDSESCHGFVFSDNNTRSAIISDCGQMNERIFNTIKGCPIVFLESNFDDELLFKSMYPSTLKRRIKGNNGHLSNIDCAKTIEKLASTGTKQIVLIHLSENSNSPLIAYSTCKSYLLEKGIIEGTHIKIDVAKYIGPSTVFKF